MSKIDVKRRRYAVIIEHELKHINDDNDKNDDKEIEDGIESVIISNLSNRIDDIKGEVHVMHIGRNNLVKVNENLMKNGFSQKIYKRILDEDLFSYDGLIMVNVQQYERLRIDEIARFKKMFMCMCINTYGPTICITFSSYTNENEYETLKDIIIKPNNNTRSASTWANRQDRTAAIHCAIQGLISFEQKFARNPDPVSKEDEKEMELLTHKFVEDNKLVGRSSVGALEGSVDVSVIRSICTFRNNCAPFLLEFVSDVVIGALIDFSKLASKLSPGSQQIVCSFDDLYSKNMPKRISKHELLATDSRVAQDMKKILDTLREFMKLEL